MSRYRANGVVVAGLAAVVLALGGSSAASAVSETPLLTPEGKEVGCTAWLTYGDEGNQDAHLQCDEQWAAGGIIVNDLAVRSAYTYHPFYPDLGYSNSRDCWMGDGLVWKVKDGIRRNGKWDAQAAMECGT